MRAREFIIESLQQTTLAQLYNGNYPDRDETFWDYVAPHEFDTPIDIQTLQRHKVMITLLGQYRVEHIDEITDMLDDEQQEIVQAYTNDPALSSKVIVVANGRIIDGNHRALAAALKGVPINYVDLADLEKETVDEAEMGTPYANEIKKTLLNAGYTMLGDGADATVWTKDQGTVIKIIMPEEGEKITVAANTFYKFYEFCQQHKDLACLPKFIDIGGQHHATFEIQGKEYLQIAMERLFPIPRGSLQESMVWALSDFAVTNPSWGEIYKQISNPVYWGDDATEDGGLAGEVRELTPQQLESYKILSAVMGLMYTTGKINKLGWDLHTENAMMRKNGDIVIIDPWFNMEYGSP